MLPVGSATALCSQCTTLEETSSPRSTRRSAPAVSTTLESCPVHASHPRATLRRERWARRSPTRSSARPRASSSCSTDGPVGSRCWCSTRWRRRWRGIRSQETPPRTARPSWCGSAQPHRSPGALRVVQPNRRSSAWPSTECSPRVRPRRGGARPHARSTRRASRPSTAVAPILAPTPGLHRLTRSSPRSTRWRWAISGAASPRCQGSSVG